MVAMSNVDVIICAVAEVVLSLQCCNPFAAVSATILHFKGGSKVFVFASFELCIL